MKKRILVADDEKAVVKDLKDRFIHWGYEVDSAFDGEETLQKVRSFKSHLLLLDLKMPTMSGMRVLEESKRQQLGVSILILTALPSETIASSCLAKGADDYIFKPFDTRRVRESVERIFSSGSDRTHYEQH
jgi:DNA-binding response OmpR family regulator